MSIGSDKRRESADRFRGIFHIAMGVLYLLVGIGVVYAEKQKMVAIGATFSYIICGLMCGYGVFRIYRGYARMTGKGQGW